jgi:hypothetical protein
LRALGSEYLRCCFFLFVTYDEVSLLSLLKKGKYFYLNNDIKDKLNYGNTGCQVFKDRIQNFKDFCNFDQKVSITKNVLLNWYISMKWKWERFRWFFDIENWLWKSNFSTFWHLPTTPVLFNNFLWIGMLIIRQFCTSPLKTRQPVLPWFGYWTALTYMRFYFCSSLSSIFSKSA